MMSANLYWEEMYRVRTTFPDKMSDQAEEEAVIEAEKACNGWKLMESRVTGVMAET